MISTPDIKRMADSYAACSSYRDVGDVVDVFIEESPPSRRTTSRPFATVFARPTLFRFQYRNREVGPESEWPVHVVWRSETRTCTYWSRMHELAVAESLGMAIAGVGGVSGGSSHTIPRLLMGDEIGGFCVTELLDTRVDGEEDVGIHPCFRIIGKHPRSSEQTIWIDKDSFLIRRMFDRTALPQRSEEEQLTEFQAMIDRMKSTHPELVDRRLQMGFQPIRSGPIVVEGTTHYEPELNPAIDPAEFHFTPPSDAKPRPPRGRPPPHSPQFE